MNGVEMLEIEGTLADYPEPREEWQNLSFSFDCFTSLKLIDSFRQNFFDALYIVAVSRKRYRYTVAGSSFFKPFRVRFETHAYVRRSFAVAIVEEHL